MLWGKLPQILNRFLVLTLGAGVLCFALLASGIYKRSYDAYTHIFFASHYASHWAQTWNPKWFTGFNQGSYPPLAHQIIALLSHAVGLEWGYILVQSLFWVLIVSGVFRCTRQFIQGGSASVAAFLTLFLSSLSQTTFQFGQLGTTGALAFLLHGLASFSQMLSTGGRRPFIFSLLFFLATAITHHLTFFFALPFFIIPVVLYHAHNSLPRSSLRRKIAFRLVSFCAVFGPLSLLLLSPFLLFLRDTGATQALIPHGSREAYLSSPPLTMLFFFLPYLSSSVFFWMVYTSRSYKDIPRPFLLSWALLAIFGLGGNTPIPRLLLGELFDTLTFDRFTLWSTIWLCFFGAQAYPRLSAPQRDFTLAWAPCTFAALVAFIYFNPVQPSPLNIKPIADFLNQPEQKGYRYLTLGFGNQLAWLSANVRVGTVDGTYFAAREIPVLRNSGIETIDSARHAGQKGLEVLRHFLKNPGAYSLKFIFCADKNYDRLLKKTGWQSRWDYPDGVTLWERDGIKPVQDVPPPSSPLPGLLSIIWAGYPVIPLALLLLWLFQFSSPAEKIAASPAVAATDPKPKERMAA